MIIIILVRKVFIMDELILEILSLDLYRSTSYYVYHLNFPLFKCFGGLKWNGTQNYLKPLVNETKQLIEKSEISQETILQYLASDILNPSYLFVAQAILIYAVPIKLDDIQRYNIVTNQTSLPKDIHIDDEILACALVCYVLDGNRYSDWDFNIIVPEEKFFYSTNDYHLTKVDNINFRQNGFIFDNKYYLYNSYIDRKPLNARETVPAVFRIMQDGVDISQADLFFRLDERLAVQLDKSDICNYANFEKFYGTSFLFSKTRLERLKKINVYYNPETFNKLLMVIKKDYDTNLNEEFWHVEVEQLPNIAATYNPKFVLTTFVHGKYYPNRKSFTHIDFIKNEYRTDEYRKKHNGSSNPDISIDYYTETKDEHYKIWCIENIDMSEELWYKLTLVSLAPKYRVLFNEMLVKI